MNIKLQRSINLLFGIIIISLLSSCDPARILTIKNKTGNNVEIEIQLEDCKYNIIKVLNEKQDFKKIELGINKDDRIKSFIFGLGIWSKEELKHLNECTKFIIIKESGKATRKIEGEELKKILPQKRKGILNQWLKIVILKE